MYKSEHVYEQWKTNGPKGKPFCDRPCCALGSNYHHSKSGWIEASSFFRWFEHTFLPHAKRLTGKVVLIGDNLAAHYTPEVIEACIQNDITFTFLPPNATHVCQPLDVCFFRPMKEAWRKTLSNFKKKYPRVKGIPKSCFAELVTECFERMDTVCLHPNTPNSKTMTGRVSENLRSGFKACGIWPFDPQVVLQKISPHIPENPELTQDLVAYLKRTRESEKELVQRRPRKKDRVAPPGRNVATEPLNEKLAEEQEINELEQEANELLYVLKNNSISLLVWYQ